ncbi:lysophospholipase L1-like esterase [Opitutaceae bacterium TAV1]|nr:lysophospholipase L1-like esterase [Opitutaceae bacterium TAV1]
MILAIFRRLLSVCFRRIGCGSALILCLQASASRADPGADIPATIPSDARNIAFVAQKIRNAETVRIGFLGGSITQGAGAKKHVESYYWRTKTRLTNFAKTSGATVESLLAAVGGTGSDYGAHRVGLQLLDKGIDLLIVEFAVNDFRTPVALDGMEGIVRQALTRNPHVAVVLFYTTNRRMIEECYDKGVLPPSVVAFHRIARHYNLAEVNAGSGVRDLFTSGRSNPETFFPDKTHPTAEGHAFYADILSNALIASLESVATSVPTASDQALPPPLGSGRFERACLLPVVPVRKTGEWTQETSGYYTCFGAWKATEAGASLTFEVNGERVALLCGRLSRLRVTGPGIDKTLRGPGRRNGIPALHVLHDGQKPVNGLVTVTVEPDAQGNAGAEIAGLALIRAEDAFSR